MMRTAGQRRRRRAGGFMLLDVLVAVLVFSLGVLTIISLQSASVRQASQAKYRAEATLLANELISRMWVSNRAFATLSSDFATGGDAYLAWRDTVESTLPGAADFPPEVSVQEVAGGGTPPTASGSRVTVVLRWRPPQADAEDEPSNLTVVTQIK